MHFNNKVEMSRIKSTLLVHQIQLKEWLTDMPAAAEPTVSAITTAMEWSILCVLWSSLQCPNTDNYTVFMS